MPPFQSRSTGASRIACISSAGVSVVTSVGQARARPRTCGVIGIDFAVRG